MPQGAKLTKQNAAIHREKEDQSMLFNRSSDTRNVMGTESSQKEISNKYAAFNRPNGDEGLAEQQVIMKKQDYMQWRDQRTEIGHFRKAHQLCPKA